VTAQEEGSASEARFWRLDAISTDGGGLHARLLDAVEQAVIATDAEGRIVYWNRHAERLYGWSEAEVLGRSVLEVTAAPTTAERTLEIMQSLTQGESRRGEFELRRKDGSTFVGHVTDSPLTVDGRTIGIVGLSVDITDRRRVDEALRRSEQRLRSLFDSIDEGYCVCELVVDGSGAAVDYRFLEINPSFEEMTGLSDPVGRTALELVPDLERSWIDTYARVGFGRETLRFEQGSEAMGRWFDVFALPMEPHGQFAIVFKDQTERRRAEQALRDNHAFVSELTSLVPGALYVFDLMEHRPTFVSQGAGSLLGYSPEELTALGDGLLSVLLHPDDAERLGRHLSAVARLEDGRSATIDYRFAHRDGSWRWFTSRDVVLRRGPDGEGRQILGIATDVTELKDAERAVRTAAEADAFRARLVEALRVASDPPEIQRSAAEALAGHLSASRVHYAEIDDTGQFGVVRADHHPGLPGVAGRYRLDDYGASVMDELRQGGVVRVEDVRADPRLNDEERQACAGLGVRAYVMVPLLEDGRPVAALVVHDAGPREWTEGHVAAVADTLVRTRAATERARLEHAVRLRQQRAELTVYLMGALEEQRVPSDQLQTLAQALVLEFADYATIELTGRDDVLLGLAHRDPRMVDVLRELRLRHRVAPDSANSVARAADGQAQLIPHIPAVMLEEYATEPRAADLLRELGPRSHMAVPLEIGGGARAALMVGITDERRDPYSGEDLRFLQELAHRAGVVLSAARWRQEEHNIAVRLQRALLPERIVWHPGAIIEARYHAADELLEVGGDWYDTFSWPDGSIAVMVGDVAGHNLDSAATMGRLRSATAALARSAPPRPAALLDILEDLAAGPDGTDYVTATCAVLDPRTGCLQYSSAGHPPILVVRPDRSSVWLDAAAGPPIIGLRDALRAEASVDLEPGSVVVLFSDGLVERRGESIDEGLDRLRSAAIDLLEEPVPRVASTLVERLGDADGPEDDVVVVCFRYTPERAAFTQSFTATGSGLAALRSRMRDWLLTNGVSEQKQDDVVLAVGEACTNVVEHAYRRTRPGPVEVRLTHHGTHVTAHIQDQGRWRPPTGARRDGGRGTQIMQTLTQHFARTVDQNGTSVLLSVALDA